MKSYKLAKYNIMSSLKPIIIYYLIFTGAITGIEMLSKVSGGNGYSSGLELSSIIFLFVLGLNSFKENFYFAQSSNIPRVDYFTATAIAILPIGLAMSIFDVIINRVYNLFRICPTIYDMIYNHSFHIATNSEAWIQNNSIGTLLGTVTLLFAFYIVAFGVGLLITMIYYKCNKTMKILISLSPLAIIAIAEKIAVNDSEFGGKILNFINNIFGISTKNSYVAVMTFICLFITIMFFIYLLVRKVVIKRV